MANVMEVVGLIPAAGLGGRLGPIPCSKEIYPVGFGALAGKDGLWPKASCQYLLEKMRQGGVRKVFIVLREGKWDIPAYLRDGKSCGLHIAYLMQDVPYGVPFSLAQGHPFVQDKLIAFGWPDIILSGHDEFTILLHRQEETRADVVLGLYPADRPQKVDMIDVAEDGGIREIVIKPVQTGLRWTWGVAVWTPVFSAYLYRFIQDRYQSAKHSPEIFVGDVFRAAYESGLTIQTVQVSGDPYIDIGTPDDLRRAVKLCGVLDEESRTYNQ
jgi:glucose-1-phosphate thymidylyltransferase